MTNNERIATEAKYVVQVRFGEWAVWRYCVSRREARRTLKAERERLSWPLRIRPNQ